MEGAMTDETPLEQAITLTVPGERRFVGIVRMFVGGLAARLGLGYEAMDDLQLAVESVFHDCAPTGEITIEAQPDGDRLAIVVGPLARDPLGVGDGDGGGGLELKDLLTALVAGAETFTRDDRPWLRLDVRSPAGTSAA
jgi:hypothetical protein